MRRAFLTVGGIWLVHHGIFRRVQYADRRVMTVNLVLLMAVAFLPFPTKLVAEAIRNASAERAAVIFYGASLLVISLLFSALWASVASDRSLLKPDVSEKEVNTIANATTPNLGFYVAVIVLAFLAPTVAAFGYRRPERCTRLRRPRLARANRPRGGGRPASGGAWCSGAGVGRFAWL